MDSTGAGIDPVAVESAALGVEPSIRRAAQMAWALLPAPSRLQVLTRFRHRVAEEPGPLLAALGDRPGRVPGEGMALELIPLVEACRFLEREAGRLLAPRRLGRRGRPAWLFGVEAEIRREPLGT